MAKSFDPNKDAKNLAKHTISLDRVSDFVEAAVLVDDRFDYGETRYRARGHIENLTYCPVLTFREGEMRPISLRRAHAKEMRKYVKET